MKSGANRQPDFLVWAVCVLLAAAALAVRLPLLESRPMHTDEAVHALILGDMLAGKPYAYDPRDFHGPTLYFLTEPLMRLMGVRSLAQMEAWHLRFVPALTWSALILLLPVFRSGLGTVGVFGAASLLLLAAPFCYFSTDFIHESLFVFATFLTIGSGWRWTETRGDGWAVAAGMSLGLLIATKETAVLVIAAAVPALFLTGHWKWTGWRPAIRPILLAAAAAIVVLVMVFTSFGMNLENLRQLLPAAGNFAARAVGQGHEKPWWTYLEWIFWPNPRSWPTSGWTLGGLFVLGVIFARRRPLIRFLAWFALGLLVLYSVIPYKTPWLMLGFLSVMALVGGASLDELWKRRWCRWPLGVFCLVGALLLAGETQRLNERFSVDPLNPLAYAASSKDVVRLAAKVGELLAGRSDAVIQVVAADSWPLPWYLRRFPNVGYWTNTIPPLSGEVLILSPEVAATVLEDDSGYRLVGMYGTRPEMLAFVFQRSPKAMP